MSSMLRTIQRRIARRLGVKLVPLSHIKHQAKMKKQGSPDWPLSVPKPIL